MYFDLLNSGKKQFQNNLSYVILTEFSGDVGHNRISFDVLPG